MSAHASHRLDTTGQRCPVPLLLTARVLADLAPGAHLLVLGDDPEMVADLRAWCQTSGHRWLGVTTTGTLAVCEIERVAAEPPS